ncbi:MAG: CoA pyrophosphatase [Bradyrhizobium sp.]|nr:MAG: CoA pyrophosphatase [Bradyrhizobium sp.]
MSAISPRELTPDGLRALARTRLRAELSAEALSGDHAIAGHEVDAQLIAAARPAAVLAPIIARAEGLTMLLTLRAADLRNHSGQIAFPGGTIDRDEKPGETALREAREEIGLEARFIEPLGWLDPYLTGTGYHVAPLVALIDPGFALRLSPGEVAETFETPFAFLMDEANHRLEERIWRGRPRKFYAMPYGERYIWGITAGILRNLYEKLFT